MSKLSLTLAAIVAITAFSAVGCGNGQDRSAKTSSTAAMVSVDVTKAKQDLDQVARGLRNVRDASDSADLAKLYGDLKEPTGNLQGSLSEVQSTSERAVSAGTTQNDEWRMQANAFTDPQLRNASGKRQNDLRTAVDALAASNATLKTTGDAYMAQLGQSLKALDLDLTQQGLQVIKPSINRLIDDEAKLRDALTAVAEKGKAINGVINP